MKVRVFVPAGTEEHAFNGNDFEFEALPKVGENLRFTDFRAGDFEVTKVGYLQEGDAFVAAVWTRNDEDEEVKAWVADYKPSLG